jgi:hypothetical protein
MTKTKYSKKERNLIFDVIKRYSFPDFLRITIRVITFNDFSSDHPKEGYFNDWNHCYLQPDNKSYGKVLRKGRYDIIVRRMRFSCQSILRAAVLKSLRLRRMPHVTWEMKSNCLSSKLYHLLKEDRIDFEKLKLSVLNGIQLSLDEAIDQLVADYFNQFGHLVPHSKVEISLKRLEICSDIQTSKGYEFSKDKLFLRRFDEVIHNRESSHFRGNEKSAAPRIAKTGAERLDGANVIKQVRGYCSDGSKLKTYLKSIDKTGSLNRLESTFDERAIRSIFGSQIIRKKSKYRPSLGIAIKKASKIHFKRTYSVLGYRALTFRTSKKKMIAMAINDYFGKYSAEVKSMYFRWGIIYTGQASSLSKGAKRITSNLERFGFLYKTNKCSYKFSNSWINNEYFPKIRTD